MNHRLTLSLLALVLLSSAGAQAPPSYKPSGAFVAISVVDPDASAKWYESHLGLKVVKRSLSPRGHAGNVVLEGNGLVVELVYFVAGTPKRPERAPGDPIPAGVTKAGAILESTDFDALYSSLQKRGAKFRGGVFEDKELRMRTFLVVDNEGNLIQFFARK